MKNKGKQDKKTLGIIGGMGPLATVYFMECIISLTPANKDQEHIPMVIDNRTTVPDRTEYLLGKGESPLPYLLASAQRLENAGADFLVMPCNTSHYFFEELRDSVNIPFINMIDEAFAEINNQDNKIKKIALIATRGTYHAKTYEKTFMDSNIELIIPDDAEKQIIMELLYCIKSGENIDREKCIMLIEDLKQKGAEAFLLGCTEAPLLFSKCNLSEICFDAGNILAKRAIEYALK